MLLIGKRIVFTLKEISHILPFYWACMCNIIRFILQQYVFYNECLIVDGMIFHISKYIETLRRKQNIISFNPLSTIYQPRKDCCIWWHFLYDWLHSMYIQFISVFCISVLTFVTTLKLIITETKSAFYCSCVPILRVAID